MSHSTDLRRQIEDLALKLVIQDSEAAMTASDWLPALEQISEAAERDRADDVCRVAAAVMSTLRETEDMGDLPTQVVCDRLQDGVARLQQAVESDSRPSPKEEFSLAQDPELLGDFILESREHLTGIEEQSLVIERDPSNAEALNSVFRGFHTIKGLAGFFELADVQELAHEIEAILDRARNGQLKITPAAIDVILQGADFLRRWVAHLESRLHGQVSDVPEKDHELLARVHGLAASDDIVRLASQIELLAVAGNAPAERAPTLSSSSTSQSSQPVPRAEPEEAVTLPRGTAEGSRAESHAVKVDTGKLDYLVDMAGEMVIAETLVRHDPDLAGIVNPKLQRKIAQLTRITAELQKTAMSMRLVPIGPLFHRMARLVRDLSRQFGKRVDLKTEGDDIELDRTIAEELADPLMHMVRNALDHGIESPSDREAAGKKATAQVSLKAYHQAGQVVVEIMDDGRGLDRAKIVAKAVERGLIASAEGLSDTEIYNLIFLPGFSTASCVTNVSGRGVGMDVVRRHIEKLRGRVEIRSAPGQGSQFLLKLPLTLAIIDGLVVGVGVERYIVPLFAVREMFRPTAEILWTVQQRSEMALVRGALLPVHRLYQKFGVIPTSEDPLRSVLVVAEVEGQRYCLLVDELIGKQEVVIKSLGETFRSVAGVAGGAILGDGRVGLILDLDRLFKEKNLDSAR